MVDWRKYPLVRIFLPFLVGVICGAQLTSCLHGPTGTVPTTIAFVAMSLLLSFLILCRHRAGRSAAWGRAFRAAAYLSFFLFGLLISTRAHQTALSRYGEGYVYRIYTTNSMQDERAQAVGERMHAMFQDAPAGTDADRAIVEAMTIGYRQGITKEMRWQFSAAGISHLLALSGFHLSILYILLSVPLLWIRRFPFGRYVASAFVLTFLWGYALITGMSPSIVRAVIFCSIVELCMLMGREVRLVNSCALAALVILLFEPLMIRHIGFQLSFCSMTGIALLQERIPPGPLLAMLSITVICSFFTFPLVAYHFGAVPLYGLLSNVFASLLAYPVVFLSAFWCVLSLLGFHLLWLLRLACFFASGLSWIARTVSGLPLSTITYSPSAVEVVILYAVVLTATSLFYRITARRIILLLLLIELLLLYAIFLITSSNLS